MVLVFDLDDTLYEETTFVKSGFRAVAAMLGREYSIPEEELYTQMVLEMERAGRGKVFDHVLRQYNLYSGKNVKRCLTTYRFHFPDIQLPADSVACLESFGAYPKYLVTDGNKIVQYNKVRALGVSKYFKKLFITHRYGVKNAKPSPYCFLQICRLENTQPHQVVYIGDNPNKDFVRIKMLGFKTVRIRQGMFKEVTLAQQYEADAEVKNIGEVAAVVKQLERSV